MRPEKVPTLNYASALDNVIATAEIFVSWLPEGPERQRVALERLQKVVAELESQAWAQGEEAGGPDAAFQQAAILAQAGYVQLEAARAIESGQTAEVDKALATLNAARSDLTHLEPLRFQKDLLQSSALPADLGAAFQVFQHRAELTLDNMVSEARDVILGSLSKFAKSFENLVCGLTQLAESLSAEGAGLLKSAVEKIIAAVKILAEYLKSEKLKSAIDYVRAAIKETEEAEVADAVKETVLTHLLAGAFEFEDTKTLIRRLSQAANRDALQSATDRMAEMSSDYVLLLKRARWIRAAVGAAGALLVFTGTGVIYSELGVPVAYLIIVVAIVIIGIHFADSGMRKLLAGV